MQIRGSLNDLNFKILCGMGPRSTNLHFLFMLSTLAAGLAIEVLYMALQPIVCFSCREKINYDRYVDLNIPEAARLVHSDLGIS